MKIYLANAGNYETGETSNDRTFPAIGVLSLASAVNYYRPHHEVIVRDGQIYPMSAILGDIQNMKPDVVGVSVLGTSYHNALQIAEYAKNTGALTIFGNDYAAVIAPKILKKRNFIDFISTADSGEHPFIEFLDYLEGRRKIEEVSKLAYRKNEEIIVNDGSELPEGKNFGILDSLPILNRGLYPRNHWDTYLDNYMQRYASMHEADTVTGVDTINRARGCSRMQDPCLFCGIADLSMRFSSPAIFWKEVEAGIENGANIFYEAFDSMSSAPGWIKKLIAAKPKSADGAKFFVYTQAIETNQRLVDLYRQLGVYRVNIGFESGDDKLIKRLKGPKDSIEQNKIASLMYRDSGIRVYGSLVLGGPGETQESLQNTVDFARWTVDNDVIASIEAQPLFPEINAMSGRWLMNPELAVQSAKKLGVKINDKKLLASMHSKYKDLDDEWLNDEMARDWTEIFCNVTYEDLLQASREIREYAASKGYAQGSGISKEL